ncbi:MAG: ABC transporter substrate-binding protein [Pseudomonadota bacterium]
MITTIRRAFALGLLTLAAMTLHGTVWAQAGADSLVRQISSKVIETAKADPAIQNGSLGRISALVETEVMPHVDFEVITRSAVGPAWRTATPAQRSSLQHEFKSLVIRVYAGAISQVRQQSVEILKTVPAAGATQVVVQTEVRGQGRPIKLDYRLDIVPGGEWKIIDVGVGGLWLIQNYRAQFAQQLSQGGVEGLIASLAARNNSAGVK